MKKRGVRGLSTIVTALIIILLVIVAVAIVWGVIKNIIKKGAEDVELGKFTVDLKIESAIKTAIDVNVKVKRNPGEGDLKGITFLIFDGNETHIFEKKDISLEPLERKTFILDYTGEIITISIAPMFKTSSGKWMTGSIIDIYYFGTEGQEGVVPCIPNCVGKECGDNGCGRSCGPCPTNKPFCVLGQCKTSSEPCEVNCSCASQTCVGQTCSDDCEGSCPGTLTLEQDCRDLMCGDSPHGCGNCADCDDGYHCDKGICVVSCIPGCGDRECGPDPNKCVESCGGGCDTQAGEWCDNGYCSSEPCEPDCEERNCGPVPNGCEESCGVCNATAGEYCSSEQICVLEEYLNTGTVYSVWPVNTAIYFDSPNLPKSGVSYTNYYVRFATGMEDRCLQIREFVTPVVPAIYNMSYIRFVTSSTSVQAGNIYEVWETYEGCQTA